MTAENRDDKIRRAGPPAVITMPAEIDITNADQVRRALLSAVELQMTVLIVDMSRTTFCDSAGVQAVVAAYRQAAMTGTQLRLVATAVRRIFTVIGADHLVPVYPTLESAQVGAPAGRASPAGPGGESGDSLD
jgi:anti-sigma B factor antagonist